MASSRSFCLRVFISDLVFLAGATYLFLRRVKIPQLRYISLPADYFPLFLLLGIAISGVLMRNVWKVDLLAVKQLAMGLVTFHPDYPGGNRHDLLRSPFPR